MYVLSQLTVFSSVRVHVEMISGRCAPQWNVRSLHTVVYVVVARVAEAEPGIRAEQLLAALHQRHAVDSRACAGGWGGEGGSRSGRATQRAPRRGTTNVLLVVVSGLFSTKRRVRAARVALCVAPPCLR